jgi:CTP:molybdopterin cytidylyltransferase MocA
MTHHLDSHGDHDLMLVLADLPLLTACDIHLLLDAWQARSAAIHAQMPVVDGVRGHPVLLSVQAVRQVRAMPSELGVRDWLGRHPHVVQPFWSARPAYVTDLDTPDDLLAVSTALAPQPVSWPAHMA